MPTPVGHCAYFYQPKGEFSEGRICGGEAFEKIGEQQTPYCPMHIDEMKKNLESDNPEPTTKE